jgi:hypothetical protein
VSRTLDPAKLPWPPPQVESRESFARRTVADAFERNPGRVWTRDALANWYAVPLGVVDEVVGELLAAGRVRATPGDCEGYVTATRLRAAV